MAELTEQQLTSAFVDPLAPLRQALRGHYDIERQIGQGAFATVYLARDLKHERKVAIKVLNADPTSETGELRFIREIRMLARLQHPNILALHDSGHVEALLYYVMPFVTGETLRSRIDRERQLSFEAACNIAREAADALSYAHTQGIIHRDIKPENILMSAGHPILADFGIARAIDLAGVRQITRTGTGSPGTPAYMSPEQLLGDREVDARSDTYSLGCVLYEMLTGKPPFAGKEGFVRRFTEPAPRVSAIRKDAPAWIDAAVERALARDPASRYPSAKEFVIALCPPSLENKASVASVETSPRRVGSPDQPAHAGRSSAFPYFPEGFTPRRVGLAFLGLVAALLVYFLTARPAELKRVFASSPALDSSRIVILPLLDQDGTRVGSVVTERLYDAFSHWRGIPLVPDTRVAQLVTDRGRPPRTENEALSLARSLGAAKLVWGLVTGQPNRARVRIHLYDVATSTSKDEFVFLDTTPDARVYAPAAMRLLQPQGRPAAADGGDGLTDSFVAWLAYGRGHVALAQWDLPAAEREFRNSLAADATYTPARIWLAHVLEWKRGGKNDEWREQAAAAAIGVDRLAVRDQLATTGLSALADGRYAAACDAYTRLTKRDSVDFLGWYGLGECRSLDSLVIPNSKSVSGWSFRSSYHSAAAAYLRALKVNQGVYAIFSASKLARLLPIASTQARQGMSTAPIAASFAAFPSLEPGDTVGFVPYPLKVFATLPRSPKHEAALRRNTDVLIAFAKDWAQRSPSSASAQEALANAFEVRGDLGDGPAGTSRLLRAIDSAIGLTRDQHDIRQLQARRIRVLFKRNEFTAAGKFADSLFGTSAAEVDSDLAWVAALTGRAQLTSKYWLANLSTKTLSGVVVPPAVAKPASEFFAYAALGVCGDQLTAAMAGLDSALRNYVDSDIRSGVTADVSGRASSLASPCTGGASALRVIPNDLVQRAQQAFARNDRLKTRTLLDEWRTARGNRRPGDVSPDYTFQEAWLRAQVGDTVGAV
ncbi:MAG: protein kinase, partial [Gemmatimonadaceae bacterium]